MSKSRPLVYFLYATITVAFFLWLIFNISLLLVHYLDLPTRAFLYVNILPAIIGAIGIMLGLSTATPLLNDFTVTLRRLLRFDNLSNPILLKLSLLAPGTYHHSINVSNLGQRAAKAIGADSLLVRVGAYYHDIGKLENPEFFIENQSESEKNQDYSSPKQAAKTIINHVAKGLELAKKNNLSEEICDLVSQHHGTTLVNYFFEQAKQSDKKCLREDFRYPGPKPSTKEAGILMISDCVEAAVRSIKDVSSANLVDIVNKIILEKVDERQLDNSGLNEKDLKKIRESLIETLGVIYHRRDPRESVK
jgi:putative nucleotidyltransferase with HDIG domain